MSGENYKVFFNAISTEHGNHLFAAGWITSSGFKPVLERIGQTSDFKFYLEKTGDVSAQVITPFQLAEEIPDNPKSTNVLVENNPKHVQIKGFKGVKPSQNTPGDWVEV